MPPHTTRAPGRPLSGLNKRVRASFTLPPEHLNWLKKEAKSRGMSTSSLLDELIKKGSGQRFAIPVPFDEIAHVCKKHRVKRLLLFGSVLSDRFTPQSDVDILIEFQKDAEPGFFEISKMQSELSKILGGLKIDLRTYHELSPYFRDEVMKRAEVIYAS